MKPKPKNWVPYLKLLLLALAGIIFTGCECFDGITSMLGIFSVPVLIIFAIGLVFTFFSIVIFLGFDLIELSKSLGVNFKSAPKLIDVYLKEIDEITEISQLIADKCVASTKKKLLEDKRLLELLINRNKALEESRLKLEKTRNNKTLKLVKMLSIFISGTIFFSGGYFAGQGAAVFGLGLFFASVAPTFWPVIVVSVFVGVAALLLYWYVQRPNIENLVGRCLGLDQEKIETLCDPDVSRQRGQRLEIILQNLNDCLEKAENEAADKEEINNLTKKLSTVEQQAKELQVKLAKAERLVEQSLPENKQNRFFKEASLDCSLGAGPNPGFHF